MIWADRVEGCPGQAEALYWNHNDHPRAFIVRCTTSLILRIRDISFKIKSGQSFLKEKKSFIQYPACRSPFSAIDAFF
jgi:hypothetical protein